MEQIIFIRLCLTCRVEVRIKFLQCKVDLSFIRGLVFCSFSASLIRECSVLDAVYHRRNTCLQSQILHLVCVVVTAGCVCFKSITLTVKGTAKAQLITMVTIAINLSFRINQVFPVITRGSMLFCSYYFVKHAGPVAFSRNIMYIGGHTERKNHF